MDALKDWFSLAAVAISLGSVVYAWLTAGSKANAATLHEIKEMLAAHEGRLASIETEWKYLPDNESVHRLELAMSDMKGQLTNMSAASEGTHRSLLRLEDFLLKSGGGGHS